MENLGFSHRPPKSLLAPYFSAGLEGENTPQIPKEPEIGIIETLELDLLTNSIRPIKCSYEFFTWINLPL